MIFTVMKKRMSRQAGLVGQESRVSRDTEAPPPLRRTAAPLARRFQQVCATIVADALADTGLTQLQYATLVFLHDEPGIVQRRLAEALGIDRNNTSVIVDQLHSMKLIDRRVNGADRRASALSITQRGERLLRSVRPRILRANERILAPLRPHEREPFIDMLVRMIEGNRALARPGAGRRKRATRPPRSDGK